MCQDIFFVKIAVQRLKDWGFKVMNFNETEIEIEPMIGYYNVLENIKEICWTSNVDIKNYLFNDNKNIVVYF